MRVGDIVVELDGRPIEGVGDLQRRLVGDVIGRRVDLRIERGGEMPVRLGQPGRAHRLVASRGAADPASIGRMERLLAWYRVGSSVGAVAALILANLVPLAGVLWFGWDVWGVLIIYWLENGIFGLFNVLKMRRPRGRTTVAEVVAAETRRRLNGCRMQRPPAERLQQGRLDPVLHHALRASSGWSTASSC